MAVWRIPAYALMLELGASFSTQQYHRPQVAKLLFALYPCACTHSAGPWRADGLHGPAAAALPRAWLHGPPCRQPVRSAQPGVPTPAAGPPRLPTTGLPASGLPPSRVPTSGLSPSGLPAAGLLPSAAGARPLQVKWAQGNVVRLTWLETSCRSGWKPLAGQAFLRNCFGKPLCLGAFLLLASEANA